MFPLYGHDEQELQVKRDAEGECCARLTKWLRLDNAIIFRYNTLFLQVA